MLLDDISRRLNPHLPWNAPPRRPRPAPPVRCDLFDLLAAHHEAAHACWNFFNKRPVHDVRIDGEGVGGGEFRATERSTVELSDTNDPKERARRDLMIMSALVDEETRRTWLDELIGFAVSKAAQHRYGARGEFYDRVCGHDDLVIDRVIAVMTKSREQARQCRQQVEEQAEEFVRQYWRDITRLAEEIFRYGRLDRAQIEAVLAPPRVVARAMPRRAGDEPNFFRRCDRFIIPPKKS